jgi:hypothetical protein
LSVFDFGEGESGGKGVVVFRSVPGNAFGGVSRGGDEETWQAGLLVRKGRGQGWVEYLESGLMQVNTRFC